MQEKKTAILIPCFNEAQTISKVVEDFHRVLPKADIYVYDNNSTDETAKIAKEAGAIVRHEYRQGKGNVIRSMFREIEADCYIMTDGDDTYPAESAVQMEKLVLTGRADMVIGDRLSSTYFTENKRRFHNFGNVLVRRCINTFWGKQYVVQDVMTGYRAFSPLFVKTFPILSQGFEIETEMTIHALDKNLILTSVPVQYRDRPQGSESKLNTYTDGLKVLLTIFKLYKDYQPLRFFSCVALILFFLAIGFFLPVLGEYARTGLVPKLPTLITAGFTMIGAMISFGVGLVLDTEVKAGRKNLEIQMNLIAMAREKQN